MGGAAAEEATATEPKASSSLEAAAHGGGGGGGGGTPHATCHTLLSLDAAGESMLVTGDAAGSVCIWDAGQSLESDKTRAAGEGGAGHAADLPLVAALPPPDAEAAAGAALESCPCAIRGLVITQTGGLAVAGGGIVYATGHGELTKFVPVGASSLAMLSDSGAREGLFQDSLLSGLHKGLGEGHGEADGELGQLV